jgi:hypothetical protein
MKRRPSFPWAGWLKEPANVFPGQVRLQVIAPVVQAQPPIAHPLAMQPELLARPATWLQRLLARPALLLEVLAQPVGITSSRLHRR